MRPKFPIVHSKILETYILKILVIQVFLPEISIFLIKRRHFEIVGKCFIENFKIFGKYAIKDFMSFYRKFWYFFKICRNSFKISQFLI